MPVSSPPDHHQHWLVGLGIAAVGIAVSLGAAWQRSEAASAAGQARFTHAAQAVADALGQQIDAHTDAANALRGLFTANPYASRAMFDSVARDLDLARRHPGVRAVAFARWVHGSERDAYEARPREDSAPLAPADAGLAAIQPPGERPEYLAVEHIWPLQGHEGILGLDLAAQPGGAAALAHVRSTGGPVASAPFALSHAPNQPNGFVVQLPVFDFTEGGAQRRFAGTVAVTIQVAEIVQRLQRLGLLDGMALAIDDQGAVREGSDDAFAAPLLPQTAAALPGGMPLTRDLLVHDRRWRLTFQPTRSLVPASEAQLALLTGAGGTLASLLLGATAALWLRQRRWLAMGGQAGDDIWREGEQRFRALFNQASMGVALLDSHTGRFLRANACFGELLGYTPEELLELDFQTITHPEDQPGELEQLQRLRTGELPEYRLEKRVIHRQGHEVWVDLTASPMWLPGMRADRHIAVVHDITARKRMEATLRSNEHRLRAVLEQLPMGLCLVQPDGRINFRNRRFVEICGFTEADVPDIDTWWRRAAPDAAERKLMRQGWREALAQAREGDGVIPGAEYSIRCHDGQQRPVEISGVQVEDGHLVTLQDLSERKAAEEEINHLAYYDPLTGLPNRRLLRDRLQQALATSTRHQRSGALLLLDLDNFKTLNETRGHDSGDNLLLQVAHRLRSCVHEDDTVARQGGDEFVVVLEDLGDNPEDAAARAEELGQRVLTTLREPYALHGAAHHSSLSMGITIFSGMRETVDELLKRADLALYRAKAAGRDTLRFYDPEMQAAVSARASLELDMREGLAQGQFELYYQPQVDHGRITGAEALLRWRHPRDGFVPPAQFIPLAEETGLILPLGEWVLQAACHQLAAWARDPATAGLSLAVNVSPRQFHQPGFVGDVLAALAGSGAEGRCLKLEMTESLLLEDVEDTIQKMVQLKGYGVGFSLDDFGTGYSSLAYLKRLPLDQLKIDQSFVRDVLTDPNDAAIARTVVALGTSLGLRVIAEGVETEAQREFLARHDCHAWQGYLFSPPVPAAEFDALVRAQKPA